MSDSITYRSDITLQLDDWMGHDAKVVRMAKASIRKTGGNMDDDARMGFINFLMRERHGVPFEHCALTFYFEVPIFVMRQLAKHRISSISEASGRYVELDGVFYKPASGRPLIQVGKPGAYVFEKGSPYDENLVSYVVREACESAYQEYLGLLERGVAREVARMVLPVNVYTSGYITLNLRSLMNLLSLRTAEENAAIKGHPQYEIELLAKAMEDVFAAEFPLVHAAFEKVGRMAP